MTLAEWQASLSELVIADADAAPVAEAELSDPERAWLQHLPRTAGFKITRDVQRWWREFRVQTAAPLTLSVLDVDRRAALVGEYVRRYPRPSSFVAREAMPFLDLAVELASDVSHLAALAEFERAMLVLGDALASGRPLLSSGQLRQADVVSVHPLAQVVCFEAPPEVVLGAASRGRPMPAATDRAHWLLIAPGLSNLARACTDAEATLFLSVRAGPIAVEQVTASDALATLWRDGALRRD
ncbi:MAG: hypothetical protein JO057_14420 [Chloroflexi bacterium]|nr:hypothetical protein [Chloroflexota bacterium]